MREMTPPVADVLPDANALTFSDPDDSVTAGRHDRLTLSAVDGTLATFMDAAAVPGAEATPTLPEPVEVALANVPLPYDVDATQHI